MRAAFVILSLAATPARAEVWQLHPDLGVKAADVNLSSSNPNNETDATYKAALGGLRLLREDNDSLWETTAKIEAASTGDSPNGEISVHSRYLDREKLSGTNYEIAYKKTHGYDPLNQLIEEAATLDDQSFETLYAGIYHQQSLDVQNDVSVYVGAGENKDGGITIESRDAQLSWDHHHTVLWTSRLRARYAEADTKQKEIAQEHLIKITAKLSTNLSYGYGWQDQGDAGQKSEGPLWGASVLYQTSGLTGTQSAYQSLAPVREITEEQTESLRGSSLYTAGWSHSRDRRRVGDPYYYADILYASAKIEMFGNQTVEAKGSQSKASKNQFVTTQDSYKSDLIEGMYTFRHRFWTRYPDANLGLRFASEHTEFAPQRYVRNVYEASYGLAW